MVIVKSDNICKSFNGRQVISNLSLEIETNDFFVVTGESGCGKTTLLNLLGYLDKVDSGKVLYNNQVISKNNIQVERRNTIGYIFQNNLLLGDKTVEKNLLLCNRQTTKLQILDVLTRLGLDISILKNKINNLSGGEQQRIAIARTLLKNNEIIFADEPTGSLDQKNALTVIELLKEWSLKENHSVFLVTHNRNHLKYATKHIEL